MIDAVPEAVDVLTLATPDVGTVQRRLAGLLRDIGEAAGLDLGGAMVENGNTRTVLRIRAVLGQSASMPPAPCMLTSG
jgi:hypothetical protein